METIKEQITKLNEMIAAKKIYIQVNYQLSMQLLEKVKIYERHLGEYYAELELLQKELESVQ